MSEVSAVSAVSAVTSSTRNRARRGAVLPKPLRIAEWWETPRRLIRTGRSGVFTIERPPLPG